MKRKQIISMSLLLILSLCVGIKVGANSSLQKIEAIINPDLKMKINGSDFNPKDEDGSDVLPITYKGRTYLPVRALSEAVDMNVGWEKETQTVILSDKTWIKLQKKNVSSKHGLIRYEDDPSNLSMNNTVFDTGLVMLNYPIYKGESYLKLDSQYQEVKFTAMGKDGIEIVFNNKQTGESLKKFKVSEKPQTIKVDIKGSQQLEVDIISNPSGGRIILGDMRFK